VGFVFWERSSVLKKGTLWSGLVRAGERALASGAQQPIPTQFQAIVDHGVPFVVRVVDNLARKAKRPEDPGGDPTAKANPFLPYDPAMFVADISPSHVGLLNRFNVVDHHLLVVTREFVNQESPLTLADFEAFWLCMPEFPALGFYNSGIVAGASQPHRHLQLVPLPLSPHGSRIPMEPLFQEATTVNGVGQVKRLSFAHAIAPIDSEGSVSARRLAKSTLKQYENMLQMLGVGTHIHASEPLLDPYNLLITRDWMALVPRSRECYASISLNALAFAGALLVQDDRQLRALREHGPMAALQHVGVPP